MDLAHAPASPSHVEVSWRPFVRHLVEMIVAMLLGMAVLGAAVSLVFALIGHSNVLHYAGLRGLLMSAYMTVGMALWMCHRGHGWLSVGEMAAAMFVPYAALIGPFAAGFDPRRPVPRRYARPDAPVHGRRDAASSRGVLAGPPGPCLAQRAGAPSRARPLQPTRGQSDRSARRGPRASARGGPSHRPLVGANLSDPGHRVREGRRVGDLPRLRTALGLGEERGRRRRRNHHPAWTVGGVCRTRDIARSRSPRMGCAGRPSRSATP